MNGLTSCAILLLGALVGANCHATPTTFVDGQWLNQIPPRDSLGGIAIWAGGNAGTPGQSGLAPAPSASIDDGTGPRKVYLVESFIGNMVAGIGGYPSAGADLVQMGRENLQTGSAYATIDLPTGRLQRPQGGWNIVFPGVIDPVFGVRGTNQQNFNESSIVRAEEAFRSGLRIDSANPSLASGLLQSFYQRMVPLTYAGNNSLVFGSRARINNLGPNEGVPSELEALTNSLMFYQRAAQVLIANSDDVVADSLLAGTYPFLPLSAYLTNNATLLESFARAIASQGEVATRITQIAYLQNYSSPLRAGFNQGALLSFASNQVQSLRAEILFANKFRYLLATNANSDLVRAENSLNQLFSMRELISQGSIWFGGYANPASSFSGPIRSGGYFRQYSPLYVPFFYATDASPSSFNNLLTFADQLISYSEAADNAARLATRDLDNNQAVLRRNLNEIKSQRFSELLDICGGITDSNGQIQPDLILALLPPEDRARLGRELLKDPNYLNGANTGGKLCEGWNRIQQAELRLQLTAQDLTNTFARIKEKQEIGNKIAKGQENIAHLILENGEKLQVLDREQGEVQAQLSMSLARIQGLQARRNGIESILKGGTSGGGAGVAGGPLAVAGGALVGAGAAFISANASVIAAMDSGRAQADANRQLGEINAQRTQIVTMERAKMQFQQRDETLYRTEEAVFDLALEAEQKKLAILLAQRDLDAAESELTSLMQRAAFLVQEYAAATQDAVADPLSAPDYRMIRDSQARVAEDDFTLAQEWLYLAVKSGQYLVNGANQAPEIEKSLKAVLAARQASALRSIHNHLKADVASWRVAQGRQDAIQSERLSLRHYIAQNNYALTDTSGNIMPGSSLESTIAGTNTAAASDEDWRRFLANHMSLDRGFPRLDIVFSTSLAQPYVATNGPVGFRADFLFRQRLFDSLIEYDSRPGAVGIRANLKTRGLNYDRTGNGAFVINLRQEGLSYIRSLPWLEDRNALNIWNLEPINATFEPYLNGFKDDILDRRATPRFHERSPANDRWVLSLLYEGGNKLLLANLDKLTDIELEFNFDGYSR